MAIVCSARFLKCSPSVIFIRLLNQGSFLPNSRFSTSRFSAEKLSEPIKYTTNKASRVQIAETIGLRQPPVRKDDPDNYSLYILVGSTTIFLIYFCIFREENDIDEILKGNPEYVNKTKELYDLKIKLMYCEQNRLPTDALKAKIEELEKDKKYPSPFRK